MLQRIISLIIKELLAVWRDEKSRIILIVPPILQLVIFSYAATLDVKNVEVAIINNDRGLISSDILERLDGSTVFKRILYVQTIEQAKEAIDTKKAIAVMHIQQDFSEKILNKEPTSIQLLLDGRRSNAAQIVQGYIMEIINEYNQELNTQYGLPPVNSIILARHWFNPNLIYLWFTVPGLLGILTLVVGLVVTGLSVARERELGTFDQLLVSPLNPFEILMGKIIPGLIIGLAEGTIIIVAAIFVFRIPFTGSMFLLYLSLFVYLLSVIGFGLFISSMSKTQQQAVLGAFIFSAPAIILSGFATPIENMPDWLQTLTLANPLRYFLVIARGLFLKDLPTSVVMENLYPMLIISIVTLTAAAWFFKRRLE
jgi:ABC-2 type transport system permease protein